MVAGMVVSLSFPIGFIWEFPKIGGKPPKWMVKIMENPFKMDDLEGNPLFSETPIYQVGNNKWRQIN